MMVETLVEAGLDVDDLRAVADALPDGLGIDVVQRIIQQHGGEIAFTSEPGRTAFSVRLPVAA